MSRLVLALTVLVVLLAACGPTAVQPSASPSTPPGSPSAPPSAPPSASPTPVATPGPSDAPPTTPRPTATPRPTESPAPLELTVDQQFLLDGIRRNAIDCVAVRGDKLPIHATGGIECRADDPAVARIGFYLFDGDAEMLEAYFARMDAEGVVRDSGCWNGEGEAAYTPGDGEIADRDGCFVNADGYANYRATMSGNHVYIGILGRTSNTRALLDFAWRGNQDVPGNPTLWGEPIR